MKSKANRLSNLQQIICYICIVASSFSVLSYYFSDNQITQFFINPYFSWSALIVSLSLITLIQITAKYKSIYYYAGLWFFINNLLAFYWLQGTISLFGGYQTSIAITLLIVFTIIMTLPGLITIFIWQKISQRIWIFVFIYLSVYILFHQYIYHFNWNEFGYLDHGLIAQNIAPLVGVHGITLYYLITALLIVKLINWFFTKETIHPPYFFLAIVWFILSGLFINERFNFVVADDEPVNTALLQGNLQAGQKINPDYAFYNQIKYQELVNNAYNHGAELIILPESAMGTFANSQWDLLSQWSNLPASLVVGSLYFDLESQKTYNTAYMLNQAVTNPNQTRGFQYYYKQNLVPFGEFIPFHKVLQNFDGFINQLANNSFTPGDPQQNNFIDKQKHTYSMEICYDITFADNVAKKVSQGAGSIITISDDIWFGPNLGPKQHLAIVQTRAMENQRQVLRAANSGITALIDKNGEVVKQLPMNETNILFVQNQNYLGFTPYSIYGIYTFLLVFILLFLGCLIVDYRRQPIRKINQ